MMPLPRLALSFVASLVGLVGCAHGSVAESPPPAVPALAVVASPLDDATDETESWDELDDDDSEASTLPELREIPPDDAESHATVATAGPSALGAGPDDTAVASATTETDPPAPAATGGTIEVKFGAEELGGGLESITAPPKRPSMPSMLKDVRMSPSP
ncbi:MAG: hypothetical protein K0V04_32400 [Deltaproteobacteria bacterium]|nr:hypothetical protein [Deltaproteobacteria bacterium]